MTARVRLAAVTVADAPSIHRWKNDAQLQALSSDAPTAETLEQTLARVQRWQTADPREIVHFIIRTLSTDTAIGFCHLAEIDQAKQRCKLGIVIGEPALWGQGLGREAFSRLITEAFQRGLTTVVAEVYADNDRSLKLCKRLGFALENTLRASVHRGGHWVDELVFVLHASAPTH